MAAIAATLERTLGRMLELYETGDRDRQALRERVEECVENVGSLASAIQVTTGEIERQVAELARDVAECERRLSHVHEKALRALTHQAEGGTPA